MKTLILSLTLFTASFGLYAAETAPAKEQAAKTLSLNVKGMTCGDCADKVTKALMGVPGVEKVAVDFKTGKTDITLKQNAEVKTDALKHAIENAGFKVQG